MKVQNLLLPCRSKLLWMSSIKILNVDDEPINGMMFRSVFKNKYNVLTADSGQQGIEMLLANQDIKVVITDMRMPGMDGIEFVNKAKTLFPGIAYFILTGYEVTPAIKKSLESGLVNRCFTKPLDIKEIEDCIAANV